MNVTRKALAIVGMVLIFSGIGFSQLELPLDNEGALNETEETEDKLIRDVSNFVTTTSPAFLIILGIILIVGSGFAKIIGYILIVFAVIRLLLSLF